MPPENPGTKDRIRHSYLDDALESFYLPKQLSEDIERQGNHFWMFYSGVFYLFG